MIFRTLALFVFAAVAEVLGCYLPYLVVREARPAWLLAPAAISLAVFAWLLTLHPSAAGRTYAAYGGLYVSVALGWLWVVEKQVPTRRDLVGVVLCLAGMAVIASGQGATGATGP